MQELSSIIPEYTNEKLNRPLVLVTGATGNLGKVLVNRLLVSNYRVRALVRNISKNKINNIEVEVFYGDITDLESLEYAFDKVDFVVHAAADTLAKSIKNDTSTVSGTNNIIKLCKKFKTKKLIYISTCNVYGVAEYPPGYKVNEDSPLEKYPEKRGSYTYTKLTAENLIQNEIKSGNINAVCFRPGTYFGSGADVFTGLMGFSFKNKLFVTIGHKNLKLPLVCTDNVADAIVFAIGNDKSDGKTYNLIDNDAITKSQYINKFMKKLYPDALFIHAPQNLFYILIIIQERILSFLGIKPFLTKYRYLSSQNNIEYMADKIENELMWKAPCRLSDMMNTIINHNKAMTETGRSS